ncbi:hypothetical protein TeGR_g6913, partial [Tetraparma gracilis]
MKSSGLAIALTLPTAMATAPVRSAPSSNPRPTTAKIINGSPVTAAEFSSAFYYQASLQSEHGFHFCGGTVLDSHWIVTAAHCLGEEPMYVSVGSPNSDNGSRFQARHMIGHECYNPDTVNYDIAMLYVEEDLTAGTGASPIGWSTTFLGSGSHDGAAMTVSGWGNMNNVEGAEDRFPVELQRTTVQVISNDACNAQYYGQITGVMNCAEGFNDDGLKTDSCQGDSGGPLVGDIGDGPVLAGVVSFGIGCATTHAGVYADTGRLSAWIERYVALEDPSTIPAFEADECEHGGPPPSPACTERDDCEGCVFDGDGNEIAGGACEFNIDADECFLVTGDTHCQVEEPNDYGYTEEWYESVAGQHVDSLVECTADEDCKPDEREELRRWFEIKMEEGVLRSDAEGAFIEDMMQRLNYSCKRHSGKCWLSPWTQSDTWGFPADFNTATCNAPSSCAAAGFVDHLAEVSGGDGDGHGEMMPEDSCIACFPGDILVPTRETGAGYCEQLKAGGGGGRRKLFGMDAATSGEVLAGGEVLADGSVLCPGLPESEYCDCEGDCHGSHFCPCRKAQECCGLGEEVGEEAGEEEPDEALSGPGFCGTTAEDVLVVMCLYAKAEFLIDQCQEREYEIGCDTTSVSDCGSQCEDKCQAELDAESMVMWEEGVTDFGAGSDAFCQLVTFQ